MAGRANEAGGFENFEVADNDGVEIYATIDGGTRQWVGSFAPPSVGVVSGGPKGDIYQDADFDQFGEGTLLTEDLAEFTFPIAGEGSALTIEIEVTTSGGFEAIALDDIRVHGAPDPFPAWINSFSSLTNPTDKAKNSNPDGDHLGNFGEFALDDDPTTGVTSGKFVAKVAPIEGTNVLTLTFPMRNESVSAAGDPPGGELVLEQPDDCIRYSVQATEELSSYTLNVSEVTGADAVAIQTGLPTVSFGWEYRTFRSPGAVASTPRGFMRVRIETITP